MLMVPYYIIANHCDLFDGFHLTFRSGKLPQRTSWRPLQLSLNLNLSMNETANGREHDDAAVDTTATLSSHVYSDY